MELELDKITLDGGTLKSGMVMISRLEQNAQDLERELAWFAQVLDQSFKSYFDSAAEHSVYDLAPPDLSTSISPYAQFIQHYQLTFVERITLILALIPHIRPQLLDIFFTKNEIFDRNFTEFGGVWEGTQSNFIPTGETLIFILAGKDLSTRFSLQSLFDNQHFFTKHNILHLTFQNDEPVMKCKLQPSDEYLSYFTIGQPYRPNFGVHFPARYIETQLTWDDLVLHPGTRQQIEEIETWLQYGETLRNDWGLAAKLRPGYRSLFYGPPGTGKTMTACLLGQATGRAVYKVDLSLIVSKYIGETEKNLTKVFDHAQHKGWILFFDEADALFGKRSETKDAHDRYANQEVSFLLQRIEVFDGIAILASNQRENIDEAFARRFESIIYFPIPRPEERLRLWRQGFSPQTQLEASLDLGTIAHKHPLAGGAIMNVIHYASLQALKEGSTVIASEDVLRGIRREYMKEGKQG